MIESIFPVFMAKPNEDTFSVISAAQWLMTTKIAAPEPKMEEAVRKRITEVRRYSAHVTKAVQEARGHLHQGLFTKEISEADAADLIDELSDSELMFAALGGMLNRYAIRSIAGDSHLGYQKDELEAVYKNYAMSVDSAAGLLREVIAHLRQFTPVKAMDNQSLDLTDSVLKGFISSSDAVLHDVKSGGKIEFI